MNILISILGLAVLILLHEAGHFFVARGVGMRPRRFYLGFPPALAKVSRNRSRCDPPRRLREDSGYAPSGCL